MSDDDIQSFDPSFFDQAPVAPTPEQGLDSFSASVPQDRSNPAASAIADLNQEAMYRVNVKGEDPDAVQADLLSKVGNLPKTKAEVPKEGKVLSFDPSFFTATPEPQMGPPAELAGPAPTQDMTATGDVPPDFGTGGGPLDISGVAPALAAQGKAISAAMPRSLAAGEAGLIQFGANVLPAVVGGINPAEGQFLAQAAAPYAEQAASVQQQVASERAADKAAGTSTPLSRGAEALVGGLYALPEYAAVPEAEGLGAVNAVVKALPASYSATKMKFAELQPQVGTAQALEASGLAGLVNLVAGSLPLGVTGTIPERIAGGAAVGAGAEEAGRAGQNVILSDHPEQQQPFEPEALVQSAALGGAMGGALGGRGLSLHEEAAANVQRLAEQVTRDVTLSADELIAQGQQLQESINAGEVPEVAGAVPGAGTVEGGVAQGGQARGPAPPAEAVSAEQVGEQPAANLQQPENVVAPVVPAAESAAGAAPAQTAGRVPAAAEPATFFARSDTAGATAPAEVADAARAWREQGTDSPYFQRYFEGSKVVDANQAPKVVYHGTGEDFSVFGDSRAGESTGHMTAPLGHFFDEDPKQAQRYAEKASQGVPADERVVSAYLSIKNPKTMSLDDFMAIDSQDEARALKAKLQQQGYDGIKLELPNRNQWVAFDPAQIKDTGNRGTFEKMSPNIFFARTEQTQTPEFKNWFGESKLVDDTGNPLVLYRGDKYPRDILDASQSRENAVFLTPDRDIAKIYAHGKEPEPVYVKANKVLDLTQDTKEARDFIREWAKNYDDWTDRESGEKIDPVDAVQSGRLFDYEGDWSGTRWKDLQNEALAGHDAAILPDWDNDKGMFPAVITHGGPSIKSATRNVGTFDPNNPDIRFARSEAPKSDNLTRDQARNVLAQEWGTTALRKMEANGLNLVSRDEMATHPATQGLTPEQRAGVTGFTPSDKSSANVVHDNVTKAGLLNDTVHELVHKNLDRILDPETRNNLANSVIYQGKSGKYPQTAAALKKIPYSTPKENYKEEVLAQTMGDLYSQPIGRKVMDAFKLGLNRMGVPLNWINAHEAAIRQIGIDNLRHFAEAPRREALGTSYQVAVPQQEENKPKPRIHLRPEDVMGRRIPSEEVNVSQEGGTAGGPGVRAGDVGAGPARVREAVAAARPVEAGAGDAGTAAGQPATGRVGEAGVVQEPSSDAVGTKNAMQAAAQRARGLEPVMSDLRPGDREIWDEALQARADDPNIGYRLSAEFAKNPRPHSNTEEAIVMQHGAELENRYDDVLARIEKAQKEGDLAGSVRAQAERSVVEDYLAEQAKASREMGLTWHKTGMMRQKLSERDFSMARQVQQFKAITGKNELSQAMRDEIAGHVKKLQDTEKQLADALAEIERLKKGRKESAVPTSRKARTPAEKKSLDQEFTSLAEQLRSLSKPKTATMFARVEDARMAAILRKMARNRSDAGETDPVKIVDAIHAEVGDVGISKQDIADTISNYGSKREPTKDELQIRYNAIKRELADLSRTQDTLAGKISPAKAKDSARQTALRTGIADLDRRINYRDAMAPEKAPPAYSETTQRLKAERDAKKQELRNIEPSPAPTKPADLTRAQLRKTNPERARELDAQDRLRAEIDKIDEAIGAGGTQERGKVQGADSAEIARLKAERAAKKQELNKLNPPRSEDSPEYQSAARNESRVKRLNRELADIRSRIQRKDYSEPTKAEKIPENEAVTRLRQIIALEKNALLRMKEKHIRLNEPGFKKLTRLIHAVHMAGMFTSGIVVKKLAAAVGGGHAHALISAATISLAKSIPAIRRIAELSPDYGAGMTKEGLANRLSGFLGGHKAGAETLKYGASLLEMANGDLSRASESYIGHLGTMAEALATEGKLNKALEVAHVALSYPGRFHGYEKQYLSNAAYYESKANQSIQIRDALTKKGYTPDQILDYLSRETTQASTNARAIARAYDEKMQGKNRWNDALLSGIRQLDHSDHPSAAALSLAFKSILPIVRIGPNVFKQGTSQMPLVGLAKAALEYARPGEKTKAAMQAMKRGEITKEQVAEIRRSDLTPERADYIMKQIGAQGTGAVMMLAIGMMFSKYIGGVEGAEEKKKPRDTEVKPGEAEIGGAPVGSWAFHGAPLAMAQIGAGIVHVYEQQPHTTHEEAVDAALYSVLSNVKNWSERTLPYTDYLRRTANTLEYGRGHGKYGSPWGEVAGNQLRSMIVPQGVQQIARWQDPNENYPITHNVMEDIQSGLPQVGSLPSRMDLQHQRPKKAK